MCHRQDPRCLVLSRLVSSSERLRPTGSPTRQFAMSRVPGFSLLALLAVLTALVSATSHVALFTDAHCQDSYKALDGPNGYPNGTCTDMRREWVRRSFSLKERLEVLVLVALLARKLSR